MIYGLLIISMISIGWGITYDLVPYYLPLSGIVVMGLIMIFQIFKNSIVKTAPPSNQNQQTPSTSASQTPPPTTPATPNEYYGWTWFLGGIVAVALIGTFYFSVVGLENKEGGRIGNKKVHFYPPVTEIQHKGETLYSARLELAAGEYEISPPANVFIGSSPDPLVKEGKRFILDKDQKMIHIIAKSKPIKLTPQ